MSPETDIQFRLSGGAANVSASLSLGGAMSSASLQTQRGVVQAPFAGVRYRSGSGNVPGTGTLTYRSADAALTWTPPGGAAGPDTLLVNTGDYAVRGLSLEYITVRVVVPLLPTADAQTEIAISNIVNNLFDDTAPGAQTIYRCLYLHNSGTTPQGPLTLRLLQPAASALSMALGGVLGETAAAVASESTEPPNVTFSEQDLAIPTLGPGQAAPTWLRLENTGGAGIRPLVAGALQIVV